MSALLAFGDYLRTQVRAEVRGTSPARFLNLCAANGLDFWNVEYIDENALRLTLHAKDFRAIAPIARKSACRLRIVSRAGLVYTLRALRRRAAFALAPLALLLVCALINTHVLSFTFTGQETVTPRRILAAMEKNGLGYGTRISTVDASELRNYMLTEIPEIIWFTVTFHGSAAHVDVREREGAPEIDDGRAPADIVSDRCGVIEDISVYSGRAKVKAGDLVAPGTTLVTGEVELRKGGTIRVRARADVWAQVYYKTTLALPLDGLEKRPTGRAYTRWSLILGKKRVDFYKKDGKEGDRYDKILSKYTLSLWEGFSLPVTLVRETLREYETCACARDGAHFAQALTAAAARQTLALDTGVELGETAARKEEDVLYAYAYGACTRRIGRTQIMP